ncbi:MAG: hypothetical protein A2020_14510 [Lentisphaerae bacterium GWF2_45_14]|nr:MAG: hypothetical protein A2020_14510 [Lentisphaerae bacterium GWF2_45_14]
MQMAKFYKMKPVQEQKIFIQSLQTSFAVKSFSLQRCDVFQLARFLRLRFYQAADFWRDHRITAA